MNCSAVLSANDTCNENVCEQSSSEIEPNCTEAYLPTGQLEQFPDEINALYVPGSHILHNPLLVPENPGIHKQLF